MAYSNLEFSGQFTRIHDLDLSIACFLVIESGKYVSSEALDDMFDSWVDSISYGGPGCIDLQLDKFLKSQEYADVVVGLIDRVIQELYSMADVYPKEKLSSMLAGVKITLNADYEVKLIRTALAGLRKVIVGEG